MTSKKFECWKLILDVYKYCPENTIETIGTDYKIPSH